jgi:hypothetical protein
MSLRLEFSYRRQRFQSRRVDVKLLDNLRRPDLVKSQKYAANIQPRNLDNKLGKKYLSSNGTKRFIIVFTRSAPSDPVQVFVISILMLHFHPHL